MIQLKLEGGDRDGAFEVAKSVLSRDFLPELFERAVELALQLGRKSELVEAIGMNNSLAMYAKHSEETARELDRLGVDIESLRSRASRRRSRL